MFLSCRRSSCHCWAWGEWTAGEGANRTRETRATWVKGLMNIHSCVADLVHMPLSALMDCVWQVLMWWLIDACQHPQDRERREDELNELRHILDENHSAVTAWESECIDKAKVQESWNSLQMPQANTGATLSADLVSGLYSGSVTCVATAAQIHRCSRKSTHSSVCGEMTQKPKFSRSWRTVFWLFRWDKHSGSAVFIVYSSQLCQYSSRSWC